MPTPIVCDLCKLRLLALMSSDVGVAGSSFGGVSTTSFLSSTGVCGTDPVLWKKHISLIICKTDAIFFFFFFFFFFGGGVWFLKTFLNQKYQIKFSVKDLQKKVNMKRVFNEPYFFEYGTLSFNR